MSNLERINIDDFSEVKAYLSTVKVDNHNIDRLLDILTSTANLLVSNLIAFEVKDFKSEKVLTSLIVVIKRPENVGKRGKLIYCCTEFDCTKYFDFFIEIVIEENGESFINAIDVIGEMKGPFTKAKLRTSVKKLETFRVKDANPDKGPYLLTLINYLNHFQG